jgi:hypothetical protein
VLETAPHFFILFRQKIPTIYLLSQAKSDIMERAEAKSGSGCRGKPRQDAVLA